MDASPALLRKPSMARSGAPTRGPFFSSLTSGWRAGTPSTASASRRGVTNARAASYTSPASTRRSVTSFFKSSAAFACMRAGISSEKSSSKRSGISYPPLEGEGRGGRAPDQRRRGGGVITAARRWAPPLVFQMCWLRIGCPVNGRVNYFHHTSDVVDDIVIQEPDDSEALGIKPTSSYFIAFCVYTLAVLSTVHLDQ